ncbi:MULTISPECIES: hypothetical protein [unclassified Paraburkholderia]|uniref:hypothetical protein n=1 Tax=unclassified Paraburkholderia TaxID=2615204 RepID=UPI002AB23378|nr:MULTISPECIES: hypothetical protein [unclassified Paraburkholderia]
MAKAIKSVVLIGASMAFAICAQAANASPIEVYGGVGTDGIGLGAGYGISSHFGARAEVDGFHLAHNFSAGDLHYDASLTLIHGGLFADFFPAPSVFPVRLTAGVLVGGDNLSGDATSTSGTYSFNGTTVDTNGESVHAKLKYPTLRPYLGIGFGHNPNKRGLSMAFDAGVAYGKPKVSFDVPADIVSAAGQENVNAEESQLQSKANKLRFYPIVKVSVTYRF